MLDIEEYDEYVVLCGHMQHNSSEYGFIARDIFWPRNFSMWRYQLGTKIIRFDTIRLFLWFYAKHKHSTLEHLKTNIRQVMAEIPPNMCQKVVENYLKIINVSHGGHLSDVVFRA